MNPRTFKHRLGRIIPGGRQLVIGVPFIWLFLFFMLPFFIVLKISFAEADVAIPPYTEIYSLVEQKFQLILNLVWFFSHRAEQARLRAIQQAIEDGAADSAKPHPLAPPQKRAQRPIADAVT